MKRPQGALLLAPRYLGCIALHGKDLTTVGEFLVSTR